MGWVWFGLSVAFLTVMAWGLSLIWFQIRLTWQALRERPITFQVREPEPWQPRVSLSENDLELRARVARRQARRQLKKRLRLARYQRRWESW